ncbi:hypothetical protein PAXRUDRAFT_16839 [Paxillus rubicundulus Ve08.2h10]|uniref:Uncharacterized protein n=1 Tax=Paxillus rubicundulus Ve08.2h10 TaxID=930991 RepID=A0A0D0CT17_9AGAM|nr:hypothetical protein PAXRUDRAFT_16839 [Paxillus rubicundulus Ve08.2h10]
MNAQQCELGKRYHNLSTTTARKNFVKQYATQYTQLARLPYFNLVDQIVINPMHNLFLGLVKMHFYNIWIQHKILHPNHELSTFHKILADFIVPGSCGKLPTDIEHKKALDAVKKQGKEVYEAEKVRISQEKLALVEAKKQEKLQTSVTKQAEKARLAAAKKVKVVQLKASKKCKSPGDEPQNEVNQPLPAAQLEEPEPALNEDDIKFSLHPDNPANFLKLCTSLHLLIKHKWTDRDIETADCLIQEYTTELIMLYGSVVIKPNRHFATHVGTCSWNFGPLHDFRTFLFECLNKVLKSYKTNNHANGEL